MDKCPEPIVKILDHAAKPITSIGMPLYRSRYIAWLGLESLCRQTGVPHPWELLVAEEQGSNKHKFYGLKRIMAYEKRLKKVGCCKILYIPFDEWLALSYKWRYLADHTHASSKYFLMQPGDCFSPPARMRTAIDLFQQDKSDWVHGYKRLIYNIKNGQVVLFTSQYVKNGEQRTGVDIAVLTELIRQIPMKDRPAIVDSWVFANCREARGRPKFKLSVDRTDNWKFGLGTYGMNNISGRNKHFRGGHKFFKKQNRSALNDIPRGIIRKLKELRPLTAGWTLRPWAKKKK